MSTDLLMARAKAVQAVLLASGDKPPRPTPAEDRRTPLDALTARAKAVQARLAEAYARRGERSNPRDG
jgi:hypothetical protein